MSASDSDASKTVHGRYHPPRESRTVHARLVREGEMLRVLGADDRDVLAAAPLRDVEVSHRVGAIPRRVTYPDHAVFETPDNAGVDRLLAENGNRAAGFIHVLERFHPRLIGIVALAVFLLFAVYRWAIPAMTAVAVALTPPVVPTLISDSALATLDRLLLEDTTLSDERRAAMEAGFRELVRVSGAEGFDFRLEFRRSPTIGPNAFALPDGTVVLTDELVELAGNDDAILSVLAHEIAHVEEQHSLKRIYRAAGISAVVMLVGGDIGELTEDLMIQGGALLALSHSREQESEADMRAVALMHAAGRNPAALAAFFRKLDKHCEACGEDSWWSTHPGNEARITAVERRAAELAEAP